MEKMIRTFTLKSIALCALLLAFTLPLKATHIIGGEMNYRCLGGNQYEITLRVYRDCYNGVPDFDKPAAIGIFNSSNSLINTLYPPFTSKQKLDPTVNQTDPCVIIPQDVCVEATEYKIQTNLPPIAGGYQLVYQRCCRNQTILNLVNPGAVGATYIATIPDPSLATCNSNPVFTGWPPIFVCVNMEIQFDHSATDPDGDSIVYKLCHPYHGASTGNPRPQPPNNPPYQLVPWLSPYNTNDPLGGVPLAIDPQTGWLTGIPDRIGQFVVGVCAEEYRNGKLISETKRDFQFNVLECESDVVASAISITTNCADHTVQFINNSTGAVSYLWDFGDPCQDPADTSNAVNPTWTYCSVGTYTVTLIAYSGTDPACNDTVSDIFTIVDSCKPCAMTLATSKNNATCGTTGTCTPCPVAVDATSGAGMSSNGTVMTWNHTCSGTNRLLIVDCAAQGWVPSTVTYAGTPLTRLIGASNQNRYIDRWYMISPPTGANPVVVTYPAASAEFGSNNKRAQATSFTCVKQDTAFSAVTADSANTCPTSLIISTNDSDLVFDVIIKDYFYDVSTVTPGQTMLWRNDGYFNLHFGGSVKVASQPSDTMSWNWTFCSNYPWAAIAVAIRPECVTTGGPQPGDANVTPAGGNPPYTYTWNNGATAQNIANLQPGVYCVTVGDGTGTCVDSVCVVIDGTSPMKLTPTPTNISACGLNDGSISVSDSGGTPPMTYLWMPNGETTQTITGLSAGTYTVVVTDSSDCSVSLQITITEPVTITANTTSTPVQCNGGSDGTVSATPSGGTGPYTYLWAPGGYTGSPVTGVPAGYYQVTVTDANGCETTAGVTITEPTALNSPVSNVNAKCYDGSDGSAIVSPTGGTPGYTYFWTPGGQTTDTASSLTRGTYQVIVTDANGCADTASVTITAPFPLSPEAIPTGAGGCTASTGSADVSVSGGTPPYLYQWCNGQSGTTATGLAVGFCGITVTDNNGCVATDSVEIIKQDTLVINTLGADLPCFGSGLGTVNVNVVSGKPGFIFSWNPGGYSTQTVTGLTPGTYLVTVNDQSGCVAYDTATIYEPPQLIPNINATGTGCLGASDGTATVGATGGTPGYTYLWSDAAGQTGTTATGLPAGPYTVTVTDTNGCTDSISTTVADGPAPPVAGFTFNPAPDCDGLMLSFINSSVNATSYYWNLGNGTTTTVFEPTQFYPYGNTNHTITLIVRNNSNCADTMAIPFNPGEPILQLKIPNVFTPNNDGWNECFTIPAIAGLDNCGELIVYNRWGVRIFDNRFGICWDGKTDTGYNAPEGTYYWIYRLEDKLDLHGWVALVRDGN